MGASFLGKCPTCTAKERWHGGIPTSEVLMGPTDVPMVITAGPGKTSSDYQREIEKLQKHAERETVRLRELAAELAIEKSRLARRDETNRVLIEELRRAKGYESDVRGLVAANDLLGNELRKSDAQVEALTAALKHIATWPMLHSKEAKGMREVAARALVKKPTTVQNID
jgi:predicted RNase H-like nuclease (RuvC/YqgF family)